MKNAVIAAVVAAFVASGSTYAATGLISGTQIKNHSIAARKLTRSAIVSLRGQQGPRGLSGPQGPQGAPGPLPPAGAGVLCISPDKTMTWGANNAGGCANNQTAIFVFLAN